MAIINGGEVKGMCWKSEREFISKKHRHLLLQHRAKNFTYLVDRIAMVCPELQELLLLIKNNITIKGYKDLRGRIVGFMLIRYTDFVLHPQQYSHKGDLIFLANWFLIQQHLFRVVGKLKHLAFIPKEKYYKFKIKKTKLYELSKLYAEKMLPITQEKLVPHYKKLNAIIC